MATPAIRLEDGTSHILDYLQVGSDRFDEELTINRAGITIERNGVPISHRPWKNMRFWGFNLNAVHQSKIEALKEFYEVGVFYLYPSITNPSVRYKVIWEGAFNPKPIAGRNDYFSLQGSFRQVV